MPAAPQACAWLTSTPLAALTVGLPLLAWGLAAVAVPVIIHLVLRERPRHQVFPALRFLLQANAAATRSHRLKHLLLLLCRMAIIALAVGLLSRISCTRAAGKPGLLTDATPANVVVCIDDSASMSYRYQGRTRLQHATAWARETLGDGKRFGPGSQFAVITSSGSESGWLADASAARTLIDALSAGQHGKPCIDMLASAYALLADARHQRREVYILTDLAAGAFSGPMPERPTVVTGVYVLDCGQDEHRNATLLIPNLPARLLPANQPLTLPLRIRSGDLPLEGTVACAVDDQPRGRAAVRLDEAGQEAGIDLVLPGLSAGVHVLDLKLEPDDALDLDNRRLWVLATGALPPVLVVHSPEAMEVAELLGAMVAPPSLAPHERLYGLETTTTDRLGQATLEGYVAVFLADISRLPSAAWGRLARYVRAGGTLVLVPGPLTQPGAWAEAEALSPATVKAVANCDPAVHLAAADLSHPLLAPYADAEVDSINSRAAFRRIELGPLTAGARTIAPYADGRPALVDMPFGKGRVSLWTFSVAREWGQFGTQAAPTIVLVHGLLELARPQVTGIGSFTAGRAATASAPAAELTLVTLGTDQPTKLTAKAGRVTLATDKAGLYRLTASASAQAVLTYAVNVPESESDPARLSDEDLNSIFKNNLSSVIRPGQAWSATMGSGPGRTDWTVPLGAALLALLAAESLFANRFYRAAPPPESTTRLSEVI